jgi:hypothetical protein
MAETFQRNIQYIPMINIHYAVQTCTTKSNQGHKRFCSDSRSEITKKCVTSFFESVEYVTQINQNLTHHIRIIDDSSDQETVDYLKALCEKYTSDTIIPEIVFTKFDGIMDSIGACYEYLVDNGDNLVFQIQDDYMFTKTAIYEMVDLFYQLYAEKETQAVISGYNCPGWYSGDNKYRQEPIVMVPGIKRYWRQIFNTSCSFLTSINILKENWDLIELFLTLHPLESRLEADSLNHMFVRRGIAGFCPINSVTFHMQSDFERDPYIDWKPIWDSIDIDWYEKSI